MKNLMNLGRTENSKQVEYLNDIRDVGMGIIFGQTTGEAFVDVFEKYLDYMETPTKYLETLKEVNYMIVEGKCTPDDLLIKMGKHCPEIEYEEPEIEYGIPIDELDELDLTDDELDELYGGNPLSDDVECVKLNEEASKVLMHILDKLCEE